MVEILLRFLLGGLIVSAFSLLGEQMKPRSFGGAFSAAPSVALASLGLTAWKHDQAYVRTELASMIFGAAAMVIYMGVVVLLVRSGKVKGTLSALLGLPIWFVVALSLYFSTRST